MWWMWHNLWYYPSNCIVNLRIVNVLTRPAPGTFPNFKQTWSVKVMVLVYIVLDHAYVVHNHES